MNPQVTSLKMENSKILQKIKKIDILILISLTLILAALFWINYSDVNLKIQNHLFNFQSKEWLVDKDELVKKILFYKLPKILLGFAIIGCLFAVIFGFKLLPQIKIISVFSDGLMSYFQKNRHRFFLIFLGLSLIPLIAGNIKKFTNVYCPNQLEIYGGDKPYIKIFDHYPEGFTQIKKAKCFPAGHAVTGFALMILFFALSGFYAFLGLAGAISLGWIIGFYQMAKGAHFFGDTLVSMLVCFFLAALIARIYLKFQKYD
jgi:membrane-associated PAP2 superfamily phosphatase